MNFTIWVETTNEYPANEVVEIIQTAMEVGLASLTLRGDSISRVAKDLYGNGVVVECDDDTKKQD